MRIFIVTLALLGSASAQNWVGILNSNRAIDWTQAGIPGGIPSGSWANCTTAACNTLFGGSVSSSTINAAIASAPNNTVVRIPAGTFTLNANTYSNRSNVVIRGAGPTQTIINSNGHSLFAGIGQSGQGSTPGGLGSTSLSTLTKGSTVLTVGNTSGLHAGQVLFIDERNNSTYVNVTGNEGADNRLRCESPLNFFGCNTRANSELVQIVSVNTSTQITIAAPGLTKTYTSSLSPQLFYWSDSSVTTYVGFENLKVNSNTDYAISFVFCHFCWAKNVAIANGSNNAAVYFFHSYKGELRDSYISGGNTTPASTEYGVELDRAALTKVENNILFGVTSPIVIETSTGVVVDYNYTLRTFADNTYPTLDTHEAHSYGILFEGNTAAFLDWDFVHGSASHMTAFRNRLNGNDPNSLGYRIPFNADYYNRFTNVIGNVLGAVGVQTQYQCSDLNPQPSENYIYGIGGFGGCAGQSTYDSRTRTSMMRWGNWDTITSTNESSTNDSTGTRFVSSEVPTADANFPNSVPASQSLPASFLYSSKPSWFGSVAWPPIGPDVTSGNISNTGGHANKIPAQVCYENTTKSNGFLTAFDAAVCYAEVPPVAPSAPVLTGITVQ